VEDRKAGGGLKRGRRPPPPQSLSPINPRFPFPQGSGAVNSVIFFLFSNNKYNLRCVPFAAGVGCVSRSRFLFPFIQEKLEPSSRGAEFRGALWDAAFFLASSPRKISGEDILGFFSQHMRCFPSPPRLLALFPFTTGDRHRPHRPHALPVDKAISPPVPSPQQKCRFKSESRWSFSGKRPPSLLERKWVPWCPPSALLGHFSDGDGGPFIPPRLRK